MLLWINSNADSFAFEWFAMGPSFLWRIATNVGTFIPENRNRCSRKPRYQSRPPFIVTWNATL